MVQQYQSPVRVYKHPFALVMLVSRQFVCDMKMKKKKKNKEQKELSTDAYRYRLALETLLTLVGHEIFIRDHQLSPTFIRRLL